MPIELNLLLLTTVANGAPAIVRNFFGRQFAFPLDGGIRLKDGQPLFGSSKTLRGLAASVIATAALAPLLGVPWKLGALIALCAMVGDAMSSFIKRRLRMPPKGHAPVLDQVPESLLPLLAVQPALGLSWSSIIIVVSAFVAVHLILSPLLFRLHIRDRPY
nr:CDP-archaeol synthase [Gammaproteobacteria bacterium]